MPFYIIGDDAFALQTYMMKPFGSRNLTRPQRLFNYRLSRARRVVENAFGILANRFRCLLTTMPQRPETVTTIVLACCCLHNIMRLRYPALQNADLDREDQNHQLVPGAWRADAQLQDMPPEPRRGNIHVVAKRQRIYLREYYTSDAGAVPWQDNVI